MRHVERFTALHLGLLTAMRLKSFNSLPRLGKTVHADPQALRHVLAKADLVGWADYRLTGYARLCQYRALVGTGDACLSLDTSTNPRRGGSQHRGATYHSSRLGYAP